MHRTWLFLLPSAVVLLVLLVPIRAVDGVGPFAGQPVTNSVTSGPLESAVKPLVRKLLDLHSSVYRTLSSRLAEPLSAVPGVALFLLATGLGILHALTPGHGKSILASYLFGQASAPLRGVLLGTGTAAVHILSTVFLIGTLYFVLDQSAGLFLNQQPIFPVVSNSVIFLAGVWLLFRALRETGHALGYTGIYWKPVSPTGVHHGWIGVAAGLIPCPLTSVIVLYSLREGLFTAALTVTVGMLVGVAISLSAVCMVTILARNTIISVLKKYPRLFVVATTILLLVTAIAILAIGAVGLLHLITLD